MDHLVPEAVPEDRFDRVRRGTEDARNIPAVVVDDPARDLAPAGQRHADGVPALEGTLHRGHPDGEQAPPPGERAGGPHVHRQLPRGLAARQDVALAALDRRGRRQDPRPQLLPPGDAQEDVGLGPPGNDAARAGAPGQVGRHELRRHPPGAQPAPAPAGRAPQFGPDFGPGDLLHQPRPRIVPRVGREQPRLVRQQHQPVGVHQIGHQRRQVVVVPHPDLLGGHRVVLVDDREDPATEQGQQGVTRVQVAPPAREVAPRQQNLRHRHPVQRKNLFVKGHEARLPHGGQHLLDRDVLGQVRETELLPPRGDGARRDQQDLLPLTRESGDLPGQVDDEGGGKTGGSLGESGGA